MPIKYTNYVLLYLSLAVFLMPVRLLGIFNTAYLILPITLVISFGIACHFFLAKRGNGLSALEVFIFSFPTLLIPLAVVNGHLPNYILTDTLKPILWVGIIGYFKNVVIDEESFLSGIKRSVLILTFCSVTTVSIVNYLIQTSGGVRASAGDIVMLFPLFYFFVRKQYIFAALMFFVLIMGGKVGPILSVLLVIALHFLVNLRPQKILLVGVLIVSVSIAITYFNFELWRQYLPVLSKFRVFFEDGFSLNDLALLDRYLFGGRFAEVTGSLAVYVESPFLMFTGPGVGYTYDLYRDGVLEQIHRHGVHLSPVSIFTIYGGIYVLVFYAYLLLVFGKSLKVIRRKTSLIKTVAAMFFIANIFNSFTVFSIFSVLLFPLCIGLILSKNIYRERVDAA